MKKLFAVLMIAAFALSMLTACGDAPTSASEPAAPAAANSAVQPESEPEPPYEPAVLTGLPRGEDYPEGQRITAVMVNNISNAVANDARPQNGLSDADILIEIKVEGGITRFCALFTDYNKIKYICPVRSARDQHLQFAMPMNSIIVHIGTSIYAENLLNHYHYATVNGMYLGSTSFWFDDARQNAGYGESHCWFTDAGLIAAGMEKNQIPATGASQQLFDFVPFDSAPVVPEAGDAAEISFSFSEVSPVSLSFDEIGRAHV